MKTTIAYLLSFAGAILMVGDGISQEQASESSLSGMVFEDNNKNSLKEPAESGRAGVIVDLLDSKGVFIARIVTKSNGEYTFEDLDEGVYFLRFEFSVGFGVRSKGIKVGATDTVFIPIPVIYPSSNYSFIRLNLMNPSNFKGNEVSPFTP